jgi:hypothetical protein
MWIGEAHTQECLCHSNRTPVAKVRATPVRKNRKWTAQFTTAFRLRNFGVRYLPAAVSTVADLMLSRFGKLLSRYAFPCELIAPWSGPRPLGAPSP